MGRGRSKRKTILPNKGSFVFPRSDISPFAVHRVCLRLLPRSTLTLSAATAVSGRPPLPSLPHPGNAQRSGQRGKRGRHARLPAKDDRSGGIEIFFPYLEIGAIFFWAVDSPSPNEGRKNTFKMKKGKPLAGAFLFIILKEVMRLWPPGPPFRRRGC